MKTSFWLALYLLFATLIACNDDDSGDACFSPTQNIELAKFDSDMGCDCDPDIDAPNCVNSLPFKCEEGKWILSPAVLCESSLSCNETPISQLDWLQSLIKGYNDPKANTTGVEITLYDYKEGQVFLIDHCINVECFVPEYEILNCQGERICSSNLGNSTEAEQCENILKEAANPRVVYTNRIITNTCDNLVEINGDLYDNSTERNYTILDVSWDGTCLKINFSSGGCDGSTWVTRLIDQGVVMESFPVQRNVKMILENEELCDALPVQEHSFDMSPILAQNDKIYLNIEGYNKQVLIEKGISNNPNPGDCTKKPILDDLTLIDIAPTEPTKVEIIDQCLYISFEAPKFIDLNDVVLIDGGIETKAIPPTSVPVFSAGFFTDTSLKEYTVGFDISDFYTAPRYISIGQYRVFYSGFSIPDTKEAFLEQLQQKRDEIDALVNVACNNADDWKWIAIGSKPCGGPWGFMAYPKALAATNFINLVDNYNSFEAAGNTKFGFVSTCDIAAAPTRIECINGSATLIY